MNIPFKLITLVIGSAMFYYFYFKIYLIATKKKEIKLKDLIKIVPEDNKKEAVRDDVD